VDKVRAVVEPEMGGDAAKVILDLAGELRLSAGILPSGVGFIAAASMNCEGKVIVLAALEIVTWPSSRGWRIVSRTLRLNSGNSSRNNTP
jgi:hypothetical protein